MSYLTLHPEKGVNPRLSVCARCQKDVSVVLLGSREHTYKCTQCGQVSIGGRPGKDRSGHLGRSICPKCGATDSYVRDRKISDYEKLNLGELCDDCIKEVEEHRAEVEKGGVYWRCSECKREGVIKAGVPLAEDVRKMMNIEPPAPCGIEFDKEHCPVCRGDIEPPDGA